jgi:dTDP-4-dehydrorhamnose reductase
MKKVVITGGSGLVGARVQELLAKDMDWIPLSHKDCDITQREQVQTFFNDTVFDTVLHMAAYTHVDKAEEERELAHKINVTGTQNVFDAVSDQGKQIIYISTDFVFSGTDGPYFEDSQVDPVGYYGQSKYEGEQVLDRNAMIVRISYPYGPSPAEKKGFAGVLQSLLAQGRELKMVTDSLFTPTYIDDIAFSFKYLINNFSPGVFHIAGSECLSPYDAGIAIAEECGYNTNLIQETSYEAYFSGKAKRPQYSDFRSRKNPFHRMRSFREGIREMNNM